MSKLEDVAASVRDLGGQARDAAGLLGNSLHGLVNMQQMVADAGRRGAGVQVVSGQLAYAVQAVKSAAAAAADVDRLAQQLAQFLVGGADVE